jgi:hypothetical protein
MKFYLVLLLICLTSVLACNITKEAVMPFRNYGYSGERNFPVKENDAQFTFRAFVNYSTSVDRIFTISCDSTFGDQGSLLEAFALKSKKAGTPNVKYQQTVLLPKSGFKHFITKVDSLKLISLNSQKSFQSALHEPIALFIIEVKHNGIYNQFKFRSRLSDTTNNENEYNKVRKLILNEFDVKFYFE